MFNTEAKISSEAEDLYSEHKQLHSAIDSKTDYVTKNQEMADSMVKSGSGTDLYLDDMHFDRTVVGREIKALEAKADENVSKAEQHLVKNPKLYSIAVKSALQDGVHINERPLK